MRKKTLARKSSLSKKSIRLQGPSGGSPAQIHQGVGAAQMASAMTNAQVMSRWMIQSRVYSFQHPTGRWNFHHGVFIRLTASHWEFLWADGHPLS